MIRQEEERNFFSSVKYLGNGMHAFTPNGKKLDGDIWAASRTWRGKPLSERQRLDDLGRYDPDRYPPKPPPGGLVMRLYRRALELGTGGRWVRPRSIVSKEKGVHPSDPQIDHLWLTAAETRALAPDDRPLGARYDVPASVTDRFCRFHLIDATTGITEAWYWKPAQVISQDMFLTVERIEADGVHLRVDGRAVYTHKDRPEGRVTYQLQGRVVYAPATRTFTRFDVAAVAPDGHEEVRTGKRQALAVAFELVRGSRPADRLPPFFINEAGYWGATR